MSQAITNRQLIPVLILMVIYSPLAIDIFLPALPIMASDLSVSLVSLQSSITVFILSLGFGQLLSGPLADRFGRRPIALTGITLYIIAAALTAVVSALEWHLFGRILQGIGACAIIVTAFACVRDRFDPIQSGVMYSYLNGAICCIPALAPILGDWLTNMFGWRSNFHFMTIYGVLAGIFIFISLKETRPADQPPPKKLFSISAYWQVLRNPIFLFNAIIIMMAMSVIIAYVSSSPAWLMVYLKLTQSEFVFWFSINAAINIAACLLAPKVLLRFGPRTTITLGLMVLISGGVAMLMMLKWLHPAAFMLPIILSSVGFSLLMGTCSGQALAPFGDNAGTASALLGFIQMSGSAGVVFLIQATDTTPAEQIGMLMLSMLPLYIISQARAFKPLAQDNSTG